MQYNPAENPVSLSNEHPISHMVTIVKYPPESQWNDILCRPVTGYEQLQETVGAILDAVKNKGDRAVKEYGLKFDCVEITQLRVTEEEITDA